MIPVAARAPQGGRLPRASTNRLRRGKGTTLVDTLPCVEPSPEVELDLIAYNSARAIEHQSFYSACYAPFVGMSFNMTGAVSVCAFTRSTPLGRIGESSLKDMWQGATIQELRAALERDDLTDACSRCAEEIAGGNVHGNLAVGFDRFVARRSPLWPTRMEFALSTNCNLQCVMCSGEFSSAIRTKREGLPPLPQRYDDTFLDELTPFLPHLTQARFLGGEPFLAEINFRIWERMIEVGSTAECNVTTNGTQWTSRIERVLDSLPFSIGVSIDGTTKDTVESVRLGASYDRIMENVDRFIEYRNRSGTSLSLTFCLMVQNWHEFVDYLLLGESLGCQVFVNTVQAPVQNSLYCLDTDALNRVVVTIESQARSTRGHLELNREVLDEQLSRLKHHLSEMVESPGDAMIAQADRQRFQRLLDDLGDPCTDEATAVAAIERVSPDGSVSIVRCDENDLIARGHDYVGVDLAAAIGQPASRLNQLLARRYGRKIHVLASRSGSGVTAGVLSFEESGKAPSVILSMVRRGPAPWTTTRIAAVVERNGESATVVQQPPARTRH